MNRTRSSRLASSWTTEAWAMPTEASSSSGLTIRGYRTAEGRRNGSPVWNTANSGTRMPWNRRIFLLIDLLRATSRAVAGEPVWR
jgi:hypothetical protein